jgi:4-amino-4-deoxy-L-arabinose transferase-like glycosyltransferase
VWLTAHLSSETRASRLFAIAAWTAAAFGAMAKGPAALVIPAGAAVVAMAARRSLRPALRLEIPAGLVAVLLMVAPWYLAVFARHGHVFTDELVLRHMLGRTLDHLHDTNTGEDVGLAYFVKQLGYATFPWTGLTLAGLLSAPAEDDRSRRTGARAVLFGAALVAFALVSTMGTKFHHYGLIVLPGAAMMTGLWLDERLGDADSKRNGRTRAAAAATLLVATSMVVLLVARDLAASPDGRAAAGAARFILLMTYRYDRRWPSADTFATPIVLTAAVTAVLGCALAVPSWRRRALPAFAGAAALFSVALLDVYLVRTAPNGGQRGVFEAYYRARGAGPAAPLVAYQLNWKGENFYTGNNIAVFVSSGAPLRAYLDRRKERSDRTVYFVTERNRVGNLRTELGTVRSFEEITDRAVSHEFSLVRAVL